MFQMSNVPVDPAQSVRRNRVHNIPDDRLILRARRLHHMIHNSNDHFPNRMDFVVRAAEHFAISVELVRRHGAAILQLAPPINAMNRQMILDAAASV